MRPFSTRKCCQIYYYHCKTYNNLLFFQNAGLRSQIHHLQGEIMLLSDEQVSCIALVLSPLSLIREVL